MKELTDKVRCPLRKDGKCTFKISGDSSKTKIFIEKFGCPDKEGDFEYLTCGLFRADKEIFELPTGDYYKH